MGQTYTKFLILARVKNIIVREIIGREVEKADRRTDLRAKRLEGEKADSKISSGAMHCPLRNYTLSIVHCPLFIVHYPLSIINCQLSIINCPLFFISFSSWTERKLDEQRTRRSD